MSNWSKCEWKCVCMSAVVVTDPDRVYCMSCVVCDMLGHDREWMFKLHEL